MSERSGGDLSTQDLANAGQAEPAGQGAGEPERAPMPTEGRSEQGRDQPQQGGHEQGQHQEASRPAPSPEAQHRQPASGVQQGSGESSAGLMQDSQGFRNRWTSIQAAFVDEPRQAVEQADGLVAEVIQHLARSFAEERSSLEQQWAGGHSVSTEDLRVSLQRYRQFFQTLLRD